MNTSDLDDIAPVIGYRATRMLAAWCAGRHVYVPAAAEDGHPLQVLLGRSAFVALVREFGRRRITVPTGREDQQFARNRVIAEQLVAGLNMVEIAAAADLSVRRVKQIRGELVRDGLLTYAQGFHESTRYPRGRRRLVGARILGTGEEFAEPPGAPATGV